MTISGVNVIAVLTIMPGKVKILFNCALPVRWLGVGFGRAVMYFDQLAVSKVEVLVHQPLVKVNIQPVHCTINRSLYHTRGWVFDNKLRIRHP